MVERKGVTLICSVKGSLEPAVESGTMEERRWQGIPVIYYLEAGVKVRNNIQYLQGAKGYLLELVHTSSGWHNLIKFQNDDPESTEINCLASQVHS